MRVFGIGVEGGESVFVALGGELGAGGPGLALGGDVLAGVLFGCEKGWFGFGGNLDIGLLV